MSDTNDTQPASSRGKKATDTGGSKSAQNQLAEVDGVINTDPTEAGGNNELATAGVGDDAVVLKSNEELSDSLFDTSGGAEFVTLTKDVVEQFMYPGTKRPAYRILYTKGQVVPKASIDALNVSVRAAQAVASGDVDNSNPAGIDETTLASGTYPGLPADK